VVNFVARSAEEITRAREDWVAGRFPEVRGSPGAPNWPRRRCLPYPSSHADPFGYWRGAGWLAAGTSGAG